jgi:hypothetical protein
LIENLSVLPFKYIQLKTTGSQIELSQTGLIEKIIKYTGMTNATPKSTPASEQPLGSNKEGHPFDEEWSYPAAVESSSTSPPTQDRTSNLLSTKWHASATATASPTDKHQAHFPIPH